MAKPVKASADALKEIVLSDGRVAVIHPFKGKHVREAQRLSDGDAGKMIFALIATCVKIDGKPVVMEDLDEMDGRDVLKIQAEFSAQNF